MKNESYHHYFIGELIATYCLVVAVVVLVKEALGGHHWFALCGITCGFIVSVLLHYRKKERDTFFEVTGGIGALVTLGWILYQVAHSSFAYNDVVSICIQGGIIVEVIFTFCISNTSFLRCIQALTLPLFMCFPVTTPAYHMSHLVFAGLYLLNWAAILRITFYSLLISAPRGERIRYSSLVASLVFFVVAIVVAWVIFSHSTLGSIKNAGFFAHETGGFGFQDDPSEKKYYQLEEKVQNDINDIMLTSESSHIKSQMLFLMSALLNESPTAADIERAEKGFLDYLQNHEQDKVKTQKIRTAFQQYIDQKIAMLIKRNHQAIEDELKKSMIDVGKWFAIVNKSNKLRFGDSRELVKQYEKEAHDSIDRAGPDPLTTEALHSKTQQLSEWKQFQFDRLDDDYMNKAPPPPVGRTRMQQEATQQDSQSAPSPESRSIEEKELVAITVTPDTIRIPLGKTEQCRAVGMYSDGSHTDITPFVQWVSARPSIAHVTKGTIKSRAIGDTTIAARLDAIKSLSTFIQVTEPELTAIAISPQHSRLAINGNTTLQATGHYSDASQKDITPLVSWHVADKKIMSVDAGTVQPLKLGKTQTYARYSQKQSDPATIEVVLPAGWLMVRILVGILLVVLSCALIVAILRLLVMQKAKKLKAMLTSNPKKCIIDVYGNAKNIIGVFGLKCSVVTPARTYATSVEERYRITNDLFLQLTKKYQEVKYSRHILERSEASIALEAHNNVVKIILNSYKKMPLFFRYMMTLLYRLPLLI